MTYLRCAECEVFTINRPGFFVQISIFPSVVRVVFFVFYHFMLWMTGRGEERGRDKRLNLDVSFSQSGDWAATQRRVGVMALLTQWLPEKELFHDNFQENGKRIFVMSFASCPWHTCSRAYVFLCNRNWLFVFLTFIVRFRFFHWRRREWMKHLSYCYKSKQVLSHDNVLRS